MHNQFKTAVTISNCCLMSLSATELGMMRNFLAIVFIASLLIACKQSGEKVAQTRAQSLVIKKYKPVVANINKGYTNLPFGIETDLKNFLQSERYFMTLIYKNVEDINGPTFRYSGLDGPKHTAYSLPKIKSQEYYSFSNVVPDSCEDKTPFNKYLKLDKYRYRLPDVQGYECYYWCDYHDPNKIEYPDAINANCSFCIVSDYRGYLIFYDRKKAHAKVLLLYYDTNPDILFNFRFFYINKDYQIKLFDFELNPEGGGSVPADPPKIRTVTFTSSGDFTVKSK